MVAVTIAIQGCEHYTEGPGPLAEKDEEVVSKALLREEETPMMYYENKERGRKGLDLKRRRTTL